MMLIGFPITITYFLTNDDFNQIRNNIFTLQLCGLPDLEEIQGNTGKYSTHFTTELLENSSSIIKSDQM